MKTIALVPLLVSALLAVLLLVGFLRDAEPITAVNPVPCPTVVPVATATPDGGPTYTATLTHTPCFIKLTSTPTVTPTPPPPDTAMSLRVDASQQVLCGSPAAGKVCVGMGQQFDVLVVADAIPANGYILAQAWIDYDNQGLVHKKNTLALWPDCEALTFLFAQDVPNNGAMASCLTGLITAPPSFHVGDLYSFSLTCTGSNSSSDIQLLPRGDPVAADSGALFYDATSSQLVPALSGIQVNCVAVPTKQPEPGDTDGDGCSDQRENGSDETLGGQRDWQNPHDFYDVIGIDGGPKDKTIDLPNDILGVIQHFAPAGAAPYDVRFDRGPSSGPNPWNMTAPDGVIDLPNDVLGVIKQFGHNCV